MTRDKAEEILMWHARWSENWGGPASDPQFMEALRVYFEEELEPLAVRLTVASLEEADALRKQRQEALDK